MEPAVTLCVWYEFPDCMGYYKSPSLWNPKILPSTTLGEVRRMLQTASGRDLTRLVATVDVGHEPVVRVNDKRTLAEIAIGGHVHMRAFYTLPKPGSIDRLREESRNELSESF